MSEWGQGQAAQRATTTAPPERETLLMTLEQAGKLLAECHGIAGGIEERLRGGGKLSGEKAMIEAPGVAGKAMAIRSGLVDLHQRLIMIQGELA